VCEAPQWDAGTFWRVDPETGEAVCAGVYQSPAADLPPWPTGQTCRPGRGLPGRVWATGEPGWVEDALGAKEDSTLDAAGPCPLRGAFGVPVRVGQAVSGVLTFYCRRQKRDEQLLDVMAELGK
jgi:hypothetical protein